MSTNSIVYDLGSLALCIAALVFVCFVVMYAILANWRATRWGRAVMRFHGGIAVVLVYVAVATLIGPLPGRDWIRLAIYSGLAALGVQQLWMMLSEQLRSRRKARALLAEWRVRDGEDR